MKNPDPDAGSADIPTTEPADPPTGVSQLSQILAAEELAPALCSADVGSEHRISWRWVVGTALTVAALALVASIVLTQNVTPLVRTAACDLMSRSTSCPASQ
jgi:hypothetical protein